MPDAGSYRIRTPIIVAKVGERSGASWTRWWGGRRLVKGSSVLFLECLVGLVGTGDICSHRGDDLPQEQQENQKA
jgi:hypothetical protein